MVDPNKIDISKIQATCEQILSKENEKKRIRRESDNQTKKQKVLWKYNNEISFSSLITFSVIYLYIIFRNQVTRN